MVKRRCIKEERDGWYGEGRRSNRRCEGMYFCDALNGRWMEIGHELGDEGSFLRRHAGWGFIEDW